MNSSAPSEVAGMLDTLVKTQNFDRNEIRTLAQDELNIFAPLLLPTVCTLPFPDFYRSIYADLLASMRAERSFDKYALGFPRGHCKTAFAKILCSSAIANTGVTFILVVCSNQDRAKDFIKDVCDSLDEPNFRKVYGNWREDIRIDRAELKQFVFQGRPIVIAAAGVGTAVRGFNLANQRPDLILCDDMQTRECAESLGESRALQTYFFATLLKAKSPKRCTFLYIGNMYKDIKLTDLQYTCLLRNLQLNQYWRSYITGAILADRTALWEDLQPLQQLLNEFAQDTAAGHGEVFAAEVLNDPTYKPRTGVMLDKVAIRDPQPSDLHQGNFIIIDPAGRKRKSDRTAILYGELYDAVPYAVNIHAEQMTPLQTVEYAVGLALSKGCTVIAAESTAYQETLLYWMELYCLQQNITGISFCELHTGRRSKNERILSSFQEANRRELGFSREAFAMWLAAVNLFDPLRVDNIDDVLDVVTYMPKCFLLYGQLMAIAGQSTITQEFDAPPAYTALSSF